MFWGQCVSHVTSFNQPFDSHFAELRECELELLLTKARSLHGLDMHPGDVGDGQSPV